MSDTSAEQARKLQEMQEAADALPERLNQASEAARVERVRIKRQGIRDGDERMRARARATETFVGKQWKATAAKMGHKESHRKGRVLHGRS